MKIDLHIHTATGSDGAMTLEEVFGEAKRRGINFMAVTDHDSAEYQSKAIKLAAGGGIKYVTGVELNVTASINGKAAALDFLGYGYDPANAALLDKLRIIVEYRETRARKIMENLNAEFRNENRPLFTGDDMKNILATVDGVLGRPHIAAYLISKGIVASRQEAFDKYLVKCDVPKYPLPPEEAAALVRGAGGRLVLAHPNDPNGTSLAAVTKNLSEQTAIIDNSLIKYIDGIECWHSRADAATTAHYTDFCQKRHLIMTGGSDCHQKPVLMGTVSVPDMVAAQFR